jgi:hypothetical protein
MRTGGGKVSQAQLIMNSLGKQEGKNSGADMQLPLHKHS